MSKYKAAICILIFPMIFLIQSCHLNDARNIGGSIVYNPTFSVPLCTFNISFSNIFDNMNLSMVDSVTATDTIPLIWFEDNLYNDPVGYYDTTFSTDFNFQFLNRESEIIKSIMFRINLLSELPCTSTFQSYFAIPDGTILDSLFSEGPFLIPPADTNQSGFVEKGRQMQTDVYFDHNKILMLQQISRLEFHLRINTKKGDHTYYKFLSRYIIFNQTGIRVEIEDKF